MDLENLGYGDLKILIIINLSINHIFKNGLKCDKY